MMFYLFFLLYEKDACMLQFTGMFHTLSGVEVNEKKNKTRSFLFNSELEIQLGGMQRLCANRLNL